MNLIQLQPDDVLVVCHPSHLSTSQRDDMVEILRQTLGQAQRVLIVDAGQSLDVLRGVAAEPVSDPGPHNDIVREVQHVDTDEPEATGIPPHVWLYRNMLTDPQAVAPLGRDETNGQYAVAIDQLTDAQQLIPHVYKQLSDGVLNVSADADAKIEENEIVRRVFDAHHPADVRAESTIVRVSRTQELRKTNTPT